MTRSTIHLVEEALQVGGREVSVLQGGKGAPILVLPRDNGHAPVSEFLERLASQYTVYHPWYPGFHQGGDPMAWDWLTSTRDLAVVQLQLVKGLGLDRPTVIGLGFGGWIAAEMATMSPTGFEALVLVAPMGIQPTRDYIYDQFLVSTEAYARRGFFDQAGFERVYGAEPALEQLEAWETDREMTSRLAWKPYMYNPALPYLLSGVRCPTLVSWGDSDEVVPGECGQLYQSAIAGAHLKIVSNAGHAVDLEQPGRLADIVLKFLERVRS
ncbi:MAG: alpha/beta hydrolase [Dehalococcoidia bacterium]